MPLEKLKLVILLKEVRDSSRHTLITSLHDLFSYVEEGAQGSEVLSRYEADREHKWRDWGEGRNYTAWDMPIDVSERKSLAYHLYRCVFEAKSPGAEITHFMYAKSFDVNIAYLHRDFFRLFVGAIDDIYEANRAANDVSRKIESRDKGGAILSNNVFIVHGHDDALKQEVARYVEKLGLRAVILAEQTSGGRTIIEKFEAHAEDAGFAIVLLTPDDVGGSAGAVPNLRSRARQNVILELGYFIGALGRSKVCALHKGDVEIPSDILGVVYVAVERNWKLSLAKEMKSANLPVDLNKALD